MGIRLWLDDKRPCPEGWTLATNAVDAIALLGSQDVEDAALDHDLGHCLKCEGCAGYKATCGCRCHWTGYTVALWMASSGRWPKNKPTCHSSNPAGKANILGVVERYFGAQMTYTKGQFRLSWKEQAAAEAFEERHYKKCKKGSPMDERHRGFTYKFHQTGIGCAVKIVCDQCRRCKNITEYEAW